ncbi:magnesium chelatase domain-containing protein [Cryptosporangium sp. NPDC048952]|uniref:magnesium chelatase domain-containing protein n=1 Tax=Cryptosporangium sp. NPDC048952 TaxID=3363961 RepID=UPI0037202141
MLIPDPATLRAAVCGQLELARVTAHTSSGTPRFGLTGLPAPDARHTRDRVRAAVINSGFRWPDRVQLAIDPRSRRSDTGLDLTLALGVLVATGQLVSEATPEVVCIGELGLDGRIVTPVRRPDAPRRRRP